MTLVGKILVIVIMVFSLLFLGFTSVVFTTATNWKAETAKQKTAVTKLNTDIGTFKAEVQTQQAALDAAKKDHSAQTKTFDDRIAALNNEIKLRQDEATQAKQALEKAQQNASVALAESNDRTKEASLLRDQNAAVRKQSDEFKLIKTELEDQKRELERLLDIAKKNNTDLRARAIAQSAYIRLNGLSDNIDEIKTKVAGVTPPPTVEGIVQRWDPKSKRVELSIGSDDGITVGHRLFISHTKPNAEYICEIQIISTDPEKSVGQVVGPLYLGRQVTEGDRVASTLSSRR